MTFIDNYVQGTLPVDRAVKSRHSKLISILDDQEREYLRKRKSVVTKEEEKETEAVMAQYAQHDY